MQFRDRDTGISLSPTVPTTTDPSPDPASSSAPIGLCVLRTSDFDEMAAGFLHWDQHLEQLGRGRFQGQLHLAHLGDLQLFDVSVNVAVADRGARPPGTYSLSAVQATNADSRWRGRLLRPGMINVGGPGQEIMHNTNADYRHTGVNIHQSLFQRVASGLLGVPIEVLLGERVIELGETVVDALAQRWRHALDALIPGDTPEQSTPTADALPSPPRCDTLNLVMDLVQTLAAGRIADPYRGTLAQRRRVVREAEEYARSRPPGCVTLLDLCEATGVSLRTLHYAFEDEIGVTPKAYLKALRLNAVWRDLSQSPPCRGLVERIANRHGFYHLGSFAHDFRRQFGILPSEALGRVAGNPRSGQNRFP